MPSEKGHAQFFNLSRGSATNSSIGGSIVNGMLWDRGSNADYDAWEELGNKGWGWSGLGKYFKKSTTFTPPSAAAVEEFGLTYNASAYGNGPVQTHLTDYQYPGKYRISPSEMSPVNDTDSTIRKISRLFSTPTVLKEFQCP